MCSQHREIQRLVGDKRGHPRAAVGAANRHSVDDGLRDAGTRADRAGDLGGRHVLALPAEGGANAIDEVDVTLFVLPHQVAGAKPRVTGLEDVAKDLLL